MPSSHLLRATGIFIGSLFLLQFMQTAIAGPLLERFMERRAEQGQNDAELAGRSRIADSLPAGSRLVRDIPYGPHPRQRMDVYLPPNAQNAPVILMVHGGGWKRGDKTMQNVVDNKVLHWLPKGFVFISVNYRLLPTDPVEQARDVASAIGFAQNSAVLWGADRSKFILMGHSAGAHLVALINADPKISKGVIKTPWRGVVSLDSGSLNVVDTMQRRHFRLFDEAFGSDPAYWQAASPYHALQQGARPLLAVCSSRRSDACQQGQQYASRATSLGVRAEVLPKDLSHAQINNLLGQEPVYTADVDAFIVSLLAAR